jgi:uncharacterized protein YdhG (YjbR/CyaY superfamily)
MDSAKRKPESVDEYLATFSKDARVALARVRGALRKALPAADEVIAYGIPAYKLDGRVVIYFAGWKTHYSVYPSTDRLVAAFKDRLAPYEVSGKGTIRFPLAAPVPVRLIADLARFRAQEEPARAKAKAKRTARSKAPARAR